MKDTPVIVWFRRDLRLEDNPALHAAVETGRPVIPLYILEAEAGRPIGGAQRWWLDRSLERLGADLSSLGSRLTLRRGTASEIISEIARETGAGAVYWNRRYAAPGVSIDQALYKRLRENDLEVKSFNGSLLREPWETPNASGDSFKVFSPFWRALKALGPSRSAPLPAPDRLVALQTHPVSDRLPDWGLSPDQPNWAAEFDSLWRPGEAGAAERLIAFLNGPAAGYADIRDRPDLDGTSRLSPHLALGEISPLQIWWSTHAALAAGQISDKAADKFLSEIAWREFSAVLAFAFPDLPTRPWRSDFERFPWRRDEALFNDWKKGRTGIPIVDAGLRELWRTGWMHNRVRMIVASFLTKNLLIDWREGERWFWDCLVDADSATNAASWQWVAGCGADAAPYFRIFNPVTQGTKFDPDGAYVRRFAPELSNLPAEWIHAPWTAPAATLKAAGVELGRTYPAPIVDLAATRERALAAFASLRPQAAE